MIRHILTSPHLSLHASYRFAPADHKLVPWAGIAPMLHLLRSTETTTIAPGDNAASSTEIGGELGGGVDYRVGPDYLAGDLRIVYSKLDHLVTGSTNAGKLRSAIGWCSDNEQTPRRRPSVTRQLTQQNTKTV